MPTACVEDGVGGERTLEVNAVSDISRMPVSDVVVIFTKSMYTMDAITKAVPIIGRDTAVLTLQNGLGNIEAIREATGNNPVIAGVTNYASDLLKPGRVELKGSGVTKMMALDEGAREKAARLVGLLCAVGHNAMLSDDVLIDIWEKVAFNAALNTTTAITGLTVGGVGSLSESRQLLFDISSEVVMVAKAEGINASESHVHGIIESVFDPEMSGDHKTSMLQDRILKRNTEIEAVCGRAVQIGRSMDLKHQSWNVFMLWSGSLNVITTKYACKLLGRKEMIKLKFFGLGGQGVVTAAKMFSEAYSLYEGNFAITIPAYGHERRGAPVNTSIIADDKPVMQNCFVYEPDVVVVMDASVIDKGVDIAAGIHRDSILVLNTHKKSDVERYSALGFAKVYHTDGTGIAQTNIGMGIPNGSMLGALAKTGIVGIDAIEHAIMDTFGKKAGEKNAKAAREAYEKTEC